MQGPQGPGLANQAVQVDAAGKVLPSNGIYVDANGVAWGYLDQGATDRRPYPLGYIVPIYTGTTCAGPVIGYYYSDNSVISMNYVNSVDWTRTSLQVPDASQSGVTIISWYRATAQMKVFPSGTAYSYWVNGPRACNIANPTLGAPGQPPTYGTLVGFSAADIVQIQRPDSQVTLPIHWEMRGQ
jgi:hypothetical protein